MLNVEVEPFRKIVKSDFNFGNVAGIANGKDEFEMIPISKYIMQKL